MKCLTVINQKGGVGKTTTAVNLAVALARQGRRVLAIDLDAQSHLSIHLGTDPNGEQPSSYTLLTKQQSIADVRLAVQDRLWMVPAHLDLAAAETELVSVIGRETLLRDALDDTVEGTYDYVIIDCPPSLGVLTLNGLCAADEVLIPMQAHFLALQGVSKLLETIQLVQRRINPAIRVAGVLLCMYEATTRLGSEVAQDLTEFFDQSRGADTPWSDAKLFSSVIRRNIKLAECPSYGLSVFDYAPKSHGAQDYAGLAQELLMMYEGQAETTGPSMWMGVAVHDDHRGDRAEGQAEARIEAPEEFDQPPVVSPSDEALTTQFDGPLPQAPQTVAPIPESHHSEPPSGAAAPDSLDDRPVEQLRDLSSFEPLQIDEPSPAPANSGSDLEHAPVPAAQPDPDPDQQPTPVAIPTGPSVSEERGVQEQGSFALYPATEEPHDLPEQRPTHGQDAEQEADTVLSPWDDSAELPPASTPPQFEPDIADDDGPSTVAPFVHTPES